MEFSKQLKSLQLMAFAILIGTVLLSTIVYMYAISGDMSPVNSDLDRTFKLVIIFMAGGGYFLSNIIAKQMYANIRNSDTDSKFNKLKLITIVRFAIYECIALAASIFYLLTGSIEQIYIVVAMIIVMLLNFPTKQKVLQLLEMSERDFK